MSNRDKSKNLLFVKPVMKGRQMRGSSELMDKFFVEVDEKAKVALAVAIAEKALSNLSENEEGMAIPGDVEDYDEDIIEPMNDDAIANGFYEEIRINTLMNYLLDKYSYENISLPVTVKKEDVMKLM